MKNASVPASDVSGGVGRVSVVYLDGLLEVVDARALGRLVNVLEAQPGPSRRVWKG